MASTIDIKDLIIQQKIISRKSIAAHNNKIHKLSDHNRYEAIVSITNEREFLNYDFSKISTVIGLVDVIHGIRHKMVDCSSRVTCSHCKYILQSVGYYPSQNHDEEKLKPRFGNLISILEKESLDELDILKRKKFPTQNDLTRWALKDAVFAFYQGLNIPDNVVVVDTLYDDRLTAKLAPDFDIIADIWIKKLDELQRRNDKYTLEPEEYDKAEGDLAEEMRGSAFEKQLDRYREEFMRKLMG